MDTIRKTLTWINAPFTTPLDTLHIFLLVGMVIVFAVLWSRILVHLNLE